MYNKKDELHNFLASYGEYVEQVKLCLASKQRYTYDDMLTPRMSAGIIDEIDQSQLAIRDGLDQFVDEIGSMIEENKTGVIICYSRSETGCKDGSGESKLAHISGYHEVLTKEHDEMLTDIDDDLMLVFDECPYIGNSIDMEKVRNGLPCFTLALSCMDIDTKDESFEDTSNELMYERQGRLSFLLFDLITRGCKNIAIVVDKFSDEETEDGIRSKDNFITSIATCVGNVLPMIRRWELYVEGSTSAEVGSKFQNIWHLMQIGG